MVQVLPYVPGFGERLAPAIEQAGATIGGALTQKRARVALNKILSSQGQNGQSMSQMDQFNTAAQDSASNTNQSVMKFLQIDDLAKKAYPGSGSLITDVLRDQQKQEAKEAIEIRKEERALGQAGSKQFFEQVESDRLKLDEEQLASDAMIDAIKSGEIDPFSQAHIGEIANAFGVPKEITKTLETAGSKEFKTARKTFISNTIKDAFRGNTTNNELKLVEEMLADLGVSKEANLAAVWGVQSRIDIRRERLRLTDELKQKGVPASKIPATVDKMLKPYVNEVKTEYFEALRELRKNQNGK